jgi:hypothetical protein
MAPAGIRAGLLRDAIRLKEEAKKGRPSNRRVAVSVADGKPYART